MKVLCVAEKPSIAKSITQILSGGQSTSVRSLVRSYEEEKELISANPFLALPS
jgi:DNA topoisomerase IA